MKLTELKALSEAAMKSDKRGAIIADSFSAFEQATTPNTILKLISALEEAKKLLENEIANYGMSHGDLWLDKYKELFEEDGK